MQIKLPNPEPLHLFKPESYNVLCYGPSGSGKTEFAATWPTPILYIDTDRGMTTVKASPRIKNKDNIYRVAILDYPDGVQTNQPLGFLTIKQVLKDIQSTGMYGEIKPATVVLDTLTTTANFTMAHVLHVNRHAGQQPTLPDWGKQLRELKEIITIGVGFKCNFIVLAHEQYLKDELSGRTWCVPLITGKLAQEIGLYFDEVYHAEVKTVGGNSKYILATKASGLITAKSRLDLPNPIDTHFNSIKGVIEKFQ